MLSAGTEKGLEPTKLVSCLERADTTGLGGESKEALNWSSGPYSTKAGRDRSVRFQEDNGVKVLRERPEDGRELLARAIAIRRWENGDSVDLMRSSRENRRQRN